MTARAILTRIWHAALSMLLLTVVVFAMVRVTGDPRYALLPDWATDEDFARVSAELGLDKPLYEQFGIFLGNVLHGNLGESYQLGIPVTDIIGPRIPATLELGAAALLVTLVVGIPLGVYSAYWRGSWLDRLARGLATLGQAAPAFWVGLLLIFTFAVQVRWLPSGGSGDLVHLIMPALTLAFAAIAGLTRLLRSSMIEVLETDYVKFLRLKGVPEREILWKHALRNSGLSALTFIGVLTAGLLTGSVVVESVFAWPGLGQLMAESINKRDFPVIQAVVLLFAGTYVAINLVVDLLYAVLNPRLR